MTTAVTLLFPDELYEQATRLAKHRQQQLEKLLLSEFAELISVKIDSEIASNPEYSAIDEVQESDAAIERERKAYVAMHPFLKENYLGKHVAIYQGRLIDSDDDYDTLYERVDANYPDVFVWLDTVTEEPLEVITLRSPSFIVK